jgi:hypothetical protein
VGAFAYSRSGAAGSPASARIGARNPSRSLPGPASSLRATEKLICRKAWVRCAAGPLPWGRGAHKVVPPIHVVNGKNVRRAAHRTAWSTIRMRAGSAVFG